MHNSPRTRSRRRTKPQERNSGHERERANGRGYREEERASKGREGIKQRGESLRCVHGRGCGGANRIAGDFRILGNELAMNLYTRERGVYRVADEGGGLT